MSIWTIFLQDRGGGNALNSSWYFLMSLLRRGSRSKLSSFAEKSSSAWRWLFHFSYFFIRPTVLGGNSSSHLLAPLLGIVKKVHQGCLRIKGSHFFIILLGPY